MITRAEAERVVRDYVAREFAPEEGEEEFAVNDEATMERPYGWFFVYTTATYLVTRDPQNGVAGAGPFSSCGRTAGSSTSPRTTRRNPRRKSTSGSSWAAEPLSRP
ncbi:YrhB domain-containing protein [Nonomuraea antimicrobica]